MLVALQLSFCVHFGIRLELILEVVGIAKKVNRDDDDICVKEKMK